MTPEQVDRYILARDAMRAAQRLVDFTRAEEARAARILDAAPIGIYPGELGTVVIDDYPGQSNATRIRVIDFEEVTA